MRKALFIALAVWILGMTKEAWSAPVPVNKPTFTCTFPDGWTDYSSLLGASADSAAYLLKMEEVTFVATLSLSNGATDISDTALSLDEVIDENGLYAIKSRGVKKIGSYDFQIITYEYTPPDSSESEEGVYTSQIWLTSVNGVTFTAVLTGLVSESDISPKVAEMESALATLDIKAVGTRIAAGFAHSPAGIKGPSARVDILGRNLGVSQGGRAPSPSLRIFQASPR